MSDAELLQNVHFLTCPIDSHYLKCGLVNVCLCFGFKRGRGFPRGFNMLFRLGAGNATATSQAAGGGAKMELRLIAAGIPTRIQARYTVARQASNLALQGSIPYPYCCPWQVVWRWSGMSACRVLVYHRRTSVEQGIRLQFAGRGNSHELPSLDSLPRAGVFGLRLVSRGWLPPACAYAPAPIIPVLQ